MPDENRASQDLEFKGLYNSGSRSKVPDGFWWRLENCSIEDGEPKVCPRYGDSWTRPSFDSGDTGWGLAYAEFDGCSEYVAIVQHDGATTAKAYSVDPDTGLFTPISYGDGTPVDDLDPSAWYFTQYDAYLYASNPETGTVYIRRVCGKGTTGNPDNDWSEFIPEFFRGNQGSDELNKPPYTNYSIPGTSTLYEYSAENYVLGVQDGAITYRQTASSTIRDSVEYFAVEVQGGDAIDLTGVDFVQFDWDLGYTGDSNSFWRFFADDFQFYFSESTSAITNLSSLQSFINGLTAANRPQAILFDPTTPTAANSQFIRGWMDIRNIADSDKNAIRRICWRGRVRHRGNWFTNCRLMWGGADMWDTDLVYGSGAIAGGQYDKNYALPLDYAYLYYNPTDGRYSTATVLTVSSGLLQGDWGASADLRRFGAEVQLTLPYSTTLYSQGFTKIAVIRKEPEKGEFPVTWGLGDPFAGRWRLVSQSTNNSNAPGSTTLTDRLSFLEATQTLTEFDPTLVGFSWPADITAGIMTAWKQHLVVGASRRVFMSWSGRPHKFLPSPDAEDFVPPSPTDTLRGRTDYLSNGRTEGVRGFASQDVLYASGDRALYYLVGDDAATASYWRMLPGTRAAVGPRAIWPYLGGVLVAAEDGLWMYEVTRSQAFDQETAAEKVELTRNVRGSWQRLINGHSGTSDASGLVVVSHDDEVWVFNDRRFMRLTRPVPRLKDTRVWEEGLHPRTVVAAVPAQGKGMRVMWSDGTVSRMGRRADGTYYLDDDSAEVEWYAQSGTWIGDRRRLVGARMSKSGDPRMLVTVDGSAPERGQPEFERDRRWARALNLVPGYEVSVEISGRQRGAVDYNDSVRTVTLDWEYDGPGAGD